MNNRRQHWYWRNTLLLTALCASTGLNADGGPAHTAGTLELLKPPSDGVDQTAPLRDRLVVFYFGSPGCGNCSVPETVEAVRRIKRDLPTRYPDVAVKCVGVCPDEDFGAATEFLAQYGAWDEVQIGGGAYAEFCLRERWAGVESGGIPRIMVFKDDAGYDSQRAHGTIKRCLVGDYALGSQIREWIDGGYPLLRLGPWDSQMRRDGDSEWSAKEILGRWRVEKTREPTLSAQIFEVLISPGSENGTPNLQIFQDGLPSEIEVIDVGLSGTARIKFVCKGGDDDESAAADATLSLDGRSLWMRLFRQLDHPLCLRLDKVQ